MTDDMVSTIGDSGALFCVIVIGKVIIVWPFFGDCVTFLGEVLPFLSGPLPPRPPPLPIPRPPPDLVAISCLFFFFVVPNGLPRFFFVFGEFVDPKDVRELMFDCCVFCFMSSS